MGLIAGIFLMRQIDLEGHARRDEQRERIVRVKWPHKILQHRTAKLQGRFLPRIVLEDHQTFKKPLVPWHRTPILKLGDAGVLMRCQHHEFRLDLPDKIRG